ncbi:MAG: hypothetical protein AAGA87_10185 [Pseudomonadota bacterium]
MLRPGLLSLCLLLPACAERPEVDAVLGPPPPGTDFPTLLPIEQLETLDVEADPDEALANEALLARGEALQRRARGL